MTNRMHFLGSNHYLPTSYINLVSCSSVPITGWLIPAPPRRPGPRPSGAGESETRPAWMPAGRQGLEEMGASHWSASGIRTGFPGAGQKSIQKGERNQKAHVGRGVAFLCMLFGRVVFMRFGRKGGFPPWYLLWWLENIS